MKTIICVLTLGLICPVEPPFDANYKYLCFGDSPAMRSKGMTAADAYMAVDGTWARLQYRSNIPCDEVQKVPE